MRNIIMATLLCCFFAGSIAMACENKKQVGQNNIQSQSVEQRLQLLEQKVNEQRLEIYVLKKRMNGLEKNIHHIIQVIEQMHKNAQKSHNCEGFGKILGKIEKMLQGFLAEHTASQNPAPSR